MTMHPTSAPRRAAAALFPILLLAACTKKSDEPTRETASSATNVAPVPVAVASAGANDSTTWITATGTFGSRDEIPLAFKIGGVVTRVLVDEGASVQRGQILAALDLREIDAAVAKAQVAVDKAQRDQARVQRLAADSVATLAQLQDATSALEAARADLASARMNRDYAIVTAPEAGIVLQRQVTAGTTVGPGTPVLTLGGSRRGRVLRAGLPDRDALRVAVGNAATVTFDAVPDRRYNGKVVLVGRSADPRTGTYPIEVILSNADALPNGLVGQLRVMAAGRRLAITVPADALLEADRDSATVYTVHPDTTNPGRPVTFVAQAQRVSVGPIEGDRVVITGVDPEAQIITRGAAYVSTGTRVRVVSSAMLDSAVRRTAARHGGPDHRPGGVVAMSGGRTP
jgi:multidrug efflux system membrane fusion protein